MNTLEKVLATLPSPITEALAEVGYTRDWFAQSSAIDILTLLTIYLRSAPLWPMLHNAGPTSPGCLQLEVRQLAVFKDHLRQQGYTIKYGRRSWQAREARSELPLHFKNFAGWPCAQVQLHIDRWGVRPLGLKSPKLLVLHFLDWGSYREVIRLSGLLAKSSASTPWFAELRAHLVKEINPL